MERSLFAEPKDRLALALDAPTLAEAEALIARVGSSVGILKVGLELFTEAGPAAVATARRGGHACFLDLKLHDIPETMARATARAVALGAKYLTVHAAAGKKALERVANEARGTTLVPLCVTVLTSLSADDLAAIGLGRDTGAAVDRLASVALEAGIDGFVTSPLEASRLRALAGPRACIVTPGVRAAGGERGDQARVATAREAIVAGADILVVGRPIRDAADPERAARSFVDEIVQALAESSS